jgi:hypothetical protein
MDPWSGCTVDGIATLACVENVVKIILNIAVRLAGMATFVMLLVGGFQYLTAGGDPKKTQAASSTLTYAIFGLVAVLAAWFIILFVEKFTGVRITEFSLPFKVPSI